MKRVLVVCLSSVLAACAPAAIEKSPAQSSTAPTPQWSLIDNFEGADALSRWTIFDAQNDTDPFVPDAQITEIRSEEAADNSYLMRKPAPDGVVGNRKALAWTALPRAIEVGETATLFTRINVEYFPNNHSFGLSNQSAEQIGALSYDAFEPMIRITDKAESDGTKNTGALMVLTGPKTYSNIDSPQTGRDADPLTPGIWYDLWYVVNNRAKADGGQTYDLYVKGGEFAEQTKVFSGATFRIGREQPLTHFVAITNTGPARAPYGNGGVRYDDIYMAPGVILSDPSAR